MPDAKNLNGVGRDDAISDGVYGKFRDDKFPCAFFDADLPAFGPAPQNLHGIVNDPAPSVSGGETSLRLNGKGDF